MADFIIGAIVIALIAAASIYMIKAKKRGVKCIGCSTAGSCEKHGEHVHCHCGCCGDEEYDN